MSQTENLFVLLILNAIELWGITDLQSRLSKFGTLEPEQLYQQFKIQVKYGVFRGDLNLHSMDRQARLSLVEKMVS